MTPLPFLLPLLLAALLALILGGLAWRHRSVPGAYPFLFCMLSSMTWSLGSALEYASNGLAAKIFWNNWQYLATASLPVCVLALALDYSGRGQWLRWRWLAAMSIIPFITQCLLWTNAWHHLFFVEYFLDASGPLVNLRVVEATWYWVHIFYSYLLLALSLLLLIWELFRAQTLHFRQTTILILSLLLPVGTDVLYNLGLELIPGYNLTPAMLNLSNLLIAWALFRYRLFDIMPIARSLAVDSISDLVYILDLQGQLVDLNPAAEALIGMTAEQAIGYPAKVIFARWPELVERYHNQLQSREIINIKLDARQRTFHISITPLYGLRHNLLGRLILLHDITELKEHQDRLQFLSTHDIMSGLYNRAHFENEVARLAQSGQPVGVLIADVDGLKQVNDQFGHAAGDELIRQAAQVLRQTLRKEDFVARIGGDEFALLMPNANLEDTQAAMESIQQRLDAHIRVESPFVLRLSMGSAYAASGSALEQALRLADDRMYQAKRARKLNHPEHTQPPCDS